MLYQGLMEKLLASSFRIIDILPERVPAESNERYGAVEQYFLQPAQAELILKLNCYYRISISLDGRESWEDNPEPTGLMEKISSLSNGKTARILIPEQETMIDLDGCDTYLTVFNPSEVMCSLLDQLAQAAGLFLWK